MTAGLWKQVAQKEWRKNSNECWGGGGVDKLEAPERCSDAGNELRKWKKCCAPVLLRLAMSLGSGSVPKKGHAPSTPCSHTWEAQAQVRVQAGFHSHATVTSVQTRGMSRDSLLAQVTEKSHASWIKDIHFWHCTSTTWTCIAVLVCEDDSSIRDWRTSVLEPLPFRLQVNIKCGDGCCNIKIPLQKCMTYPASCWEH